MRLGLFNRKYTDDRLKEIIPVQMPRVTQQEPTILKPITTQGITQEQFNQALRDQAENLNKSFQAQFQTLRKNIANARTDQHPSVTEMQTRLNSELEDYNRRLDKQGDWIPIPQSSNRIDNIAKRVTRELVRRREQQEMDKLINSFKDLNVAPKKQPLRWPSKWLHDSRDDDDLMDTSDLVDDDDYEIQVVRKKK